MRRFVLGWKKPGWSSSLGTRIVTYADDLVILCRKGKAEEALSRLREIMGKLKLTVNEEKTRIWQGAGRSVRLPGLHVRAGSIRRPPARPVWACGRRRRVFAAWSSRFMTYTDRHTRDGKRPRKWWGS